MCAKYDIGFHHSNGDFEECVCVQGPFYLHFSAMQVLQLGENSQVATTLQPLVAEMQIDLAEK